MFGLIMGQFSLWLFLILGSASIWGIGVWKKKVLPLLFVENVVYAIVIILMFSLGIRYGVNVDDYCILNGHVRSATYAAEWTEETFTVVTDRDSKGNVTGSHVERSETHHPSTWTADTTLGSFDIDNSIYTGFVKRFGNSRQIGSHHSGQCSGDGRTFYTGWNSRLDTFIPWCSTTNVINWVKASKGTVEKRMAGEGYTVPVYPAVLDTPHGPKFPRVVLAGTKVDPAWNAAMEWDMDVLADKVGDLKQCNPLVVLTNQGVGFSEALRAQWVNGKKNDVILIIGSKQWPIIDWTDVICWSSDASLVPSVKMAMQETDLNNRGKIVDILTGNILNHYQRRHMAEFEYLKNGINIPSWITPICFILLLAAAVVTWFLDSEESYNPYRRFR